MEALLHYFPDLTPTQIAQFEKLGPLYKEWNSKINVVSRKDIDNIYEHHILHSMALSHIIQPRPEAEILDLGTGGGLPGIPMAILFPETRFILIDGTRKKITVVKEIIEAIGLKNVTPKHIRAEELTHKFDYVICRAVTSIDRLVLWSKKLIKHKQIHALPNGLITLKGGNVAEEMELLNRGEYAELYPLTEFYEEEYYDEKYAVYVQW